MVVTKISAKDFATREDIEKHIKLNYGVDITENAKADVVISGTREELKKLGLNDKRGLYGVSVDMTDKSTPAREEKTDKETAKYTSRELRSKNFTKKQNK